MQAKTNALKYNFYISHSFIFHCSALYQNPLKAEFLYIFIIHMLKCASMISKAIADGKRKKRHSKSLLNKTL